jgi:hypothetical protein
VSLQHLSRQFREAVEFSQPNDRMRRLRVGGAFDPDRSWGALEALEGASPLTAWLADSLLQGLMLPLASTAGNARLSEHEDPSGQAHVLGLELDGEPEGSSREAALVDCLDFVHGTEQRGFEG